MTSTIFAPLTGRGGAVTLIRLSGPAAFALLAQLTPKPLNPRAATLRQLRLGTELLDTALITIFPAPNSFTGEDCVELSLHGGRAVLHAVSGALIELGARPAEPGEFSRRAFANNKLDLLAAESMADLIAAETNSQRRLALQGQDTLPTIIADWRESLRQIIAQQEALIDFPDEDLPPAVEAKLLARLATLRDEMQAALRAAPAAARLREGLEFVILGAPNAGKSTLLNALAGEDIAIVSDIPGTTRDAIGTRLDLAGIPVHITDTAGLRDTSDAIEAEGVRRTRARAAKADLIIAAAPVTHPRFPVTPSGIPVLHILTKSDLAAPPPGALAICALTGAGMAEFRAALITAATRLTDISAPAALPRARQAACIRDTAEALSAALAQPEPELRGEDLRAAAFALARLTGAMGVEEILDAVFSGFCIGK